MLIESFLFIFTFLLSLPTATTTHIFPQPKCQTTFASISFEETVNLETDAATFTHRIKEVLNLARPASAEAVLEATAIHSVVSS